MGVRHCVRRLTSLLDKVASCQKVLLPRSHTSSQELCEEVTEGRSDRESQVPTLPREALQRTEKRLVGTQSHPRLIDPQPLHLLPTIQDDHGGASSQASDDRSFYYLCRLKRRILAYTNSCVFKTFPRVLDRSQEVPVQGPSIRPECSSKDVYQAVQRHPKGPQTPGREHHSVPGRLVDLGKQPGGMPAEHQDCPSNPRTLRVRSKRGEVSSKSSKNLHVARNPLGFGLRNAVSASRIPAQGGGEGQGNDSLLPAHKEEARVTGGSLAVCFDHRQSSVDTNQRLQQTHEVACQTKTQRPEASSSSEAEGSPQTLEEDVVLREASSTGFTSCHAYPTFRCVHSRMGGPRWEGDSIRELVPYSRQLPYQFLGVDGSLPGTSSSCSAEEPRQLMLDNSAAVACLKRGGSRSPPLNLVVLAINRLMEKRKVFLSAVHIVGTSNVLADALSRDRVVSTEWSLSRNTFLSIFRNHPDLEVDIFVTRRNHQLPQYVSPFQDPGAVAVDAFKVNWNRWKAIFLFPPTPQISKVLDRLKSFRGKAVLVAPYWPTSHFFIPLRTAARSWTPLRSPVLSQTVGGRKVFNDYCRTLNLHVWIFSTSLITPRIF